MQKKDKENYFDISKQIWEQKYRYNSSDEGTGDKDINDTFARVAKAAAQPEKNKSLWTKKFLEILEDCKFLPGGRIISNAGTERSAVTMFNCYVMNTIEDSIEGIFDTVKEAALTQKQGGGVGFDFSTLRPAGSYIRGCEASSSGPLSFMQVLDSTCRTIMSAGQRRGAQMAVMRCDHPDIMEFISAKRKNAQLQMFNLSVAVTDKFMEALKNNEPWELIFNGEVKKTVHAVELWEHIMHSTYDFAEPGIVFIDRINKMNNLYYCEKISATNPCVSSETWIHTSSGPRKVADLIGKPTTCRVNGNDYQSPNGFFKSGTKILLKLDTKEGYSIRLTTEHPLKKVLRISQDRVETEWVKVEELRNGDKLVLNNHRGNIHWGGNGSCDDGYRIGVEEIITDDIEKSSSDFCKGFLRAIFDSKGTLQETRKEGFTVKFSNRELPFLQALQRILLRFGIVSKISKKKILIGAKLSAKPSQKSHKNKEQYELVISGDNVLEFDKVVGFCESRKVGSLRAKIAKHRERLPKENFVVEVSQILPDGTEDVYDIAVPGINCFDGNGFLAHNCGEQPLPPYGACLLGSVNLTKFVKKPFTKNASFDFSAIEKFVKTAVRLLDNVIEISGFPLEAQKNEAKNKRRMGLGITGLGDTFCMLGLKYGSDESAKIAEKIMSLITFSAYEESCSLAVEKGAFKLFDPDKYLKSEFVRVLPDELKRSIKKHGLRNSHLTSIAPTGTISLLAGNISSGIEPIFALKYKRKIRTGANDETKTVDVYDYAYRKYVEEYGDEKIPDYFVTSDDISPDDHLKIQSALQKYVDSSISKTINVPADFPYDKFKDVYRKAYELGLKGCTTFRPSEHITGVLTKEENKKKDNKSNGTALAAQIYIQRPPELEGTTYKIKTPLSSEAIYLTINDLVEENGNRRPYELFINTKNLQHFSWIVAMTRLISAVFRREPDPSFLVEELKSIYDPNGGYFSESKYVPSLAADIGFVIEKHLLKLGIIRDKKVDSKKQKFESNKERQTDKKMAFCSQCNQPTLYSQENCLKCLSCGYSKCS